MKYEDFNSATIRKELTGEDLSPTASILDTISAGRTKSPKNFKDLVLPSLQKNINAVPFAMFACPVCKEMYFSEEEAEECSNLEQEFISAFEDIKTGAFVLWKDVHTGFPTLQECTNITHAWNGNKCGNIMTIHLDEKIYLDAKKWDQYHRLVRPVSKNEKEKILEIQNKVKTQAKKMVLQSIKEERDISEQNAIRYVIREMKEKGEWKSFFHF